MSNLYRGILFGAVLLPVFPASRAWAQQSTPAPAGAAKDSPAAITAPIPLSAYSAIGSAVAEGNRLAELGWNDAQIDAFIEGVRAALHGKPYPFDSVAQDASNAIGRQVAAIESREREQMFKAPGFLDKYLKNACKQMGLEQSDSGLCYGIKNGDKGIRPGPDDTVVVSCIAIAADGKTPLPQLSNKEARGKVSTMLPGFVEGLQMMTVGGEAMLVLPPALSFGDGVWPPGVDRGTPLMFHVTLKQVISAGSTN